MRFIHHCVLGAEDVCWLSRGLCVRCVVAPARVSRVAHLLVAVQRSALLFRQSPSFLLMINGVPVTEVTSTA